VNIWAIIVNWNLCQDTMDCIDSLLKADPPSPRVLVIDNASADGSVESIRAKFSEVEIMANYRNAGFVAACNQGIEYAMKLGADYVLLINNDTVVDRRFLFELIRMAEAHPSVGIVGPLILFADRPNRVWSLGDSIQPFWPVPRPVVRRGASVFSVMSHALAVDYVTGCAMLIKRTVVERIGGFDLSFKMYYEDADFCRRSRMAGFQIMAVPSSRVFHKVSASGQRVPEQTAYYQTRNRLRFYRRYRHGPSPLLTLAYLLADNTRLILTDVIGGRWQVAKARWGGLREGIGHA